MSGPPPRHPVKRGWCPDVLHPMPTGDGLLVRLHPPLGRLNAAQLRAIAAAAQRHGNGRLDISGRGNLQIRGVGQPSHPALVDELAAAGLVDPAGPGGPHRTIVSPLAGRDPADHLDAAALARQVEAAVRTVAELPPKLATAVDGGGLFPLVELSADIYAVAIDNTAVAIGLGSAAGPRWCGTAAPSELPVALTALLTGFATAAASGQSLTPMRDLPDDLRAMLAAAARLGPPTVPRSRPAAPRAGILEMPDGGAGVVVAPPFGRLEAGQLIEVAGWAKRFGDGEVRLSPWRGIVFPSIRPEHLAALTALACGAGLIAEPGDPRLAIFACPGSPDCASASLATRRDAYRLAAAAGPLLRGGAQIHVSGCAKGCAHPGAAALTLVGDDSAYRVVVEGSPHDPAIARLAIGEIEERLRSIKAPADLASRFAAER
ncbi:MAG: precorrin-3B synthase [Stellaceae bacterium]